MAFNVGKGLTGGLSGASTGAQIGSFGGPWGQAIGAGIGGLAGLLGGGIGGSDNGMGNTSMVQQQGANGLVGGQAQIPGYGTLLRTSPYSAQQQGASQSLLMQALQGLGGGEGGTAALARKRFSERTVPGIAERFTSMGGQRSSAFGQQLGQAGADLEAQLAGLGDQRLMQMLQFGLQPQYENAYLPQQPSTLGRLGSSFLAGGGGKSLIEALPTLLKLLSNFGGNKQPDTGGGQQPTDVSGIYG